MRNITHHCTFILLVLKFSLFAQTVKKNDIKNNSDVYYWGEASAYNIEEASNSALKSLLHQISFKIKHTFVNKVKGENEVYKENVESVLETYAAATLNNIKTIKEQTGDTYSVFHYINRNEVIKIFEERKKLVKNIYEKAIEFEDNNNLGYALKWYYFCTVLMNSIPEMNLYFNEVNLVTEIPIRINRIINNVNFVLISDIRINAKERELILRTTSKDKPIELLDFSFWDGSNQVSVRAYDGEGVFRLFGSSVDFTDLKINIKYNYYESREEIQEIADLWDMVNKPTFKNIQAISLPEQKSQQTRLTPNVIDEINNSMITYTVTDDCNVKDEISKETLVLVDLIEKRDIAKINELYKDDDFLKKKISDFINYNNPKIINRELEAEINKTYEGWEIRKIPILVYYSSISKQTKEYLILDFTNEGKLNDFNLGITENLYDDFVTQAKFGNDWGNRHVIIKFMEKYRTAFLTRNMKTLETLFSDEAIIIVGRIIQKNKLNENYKYAQLSKNQPDAEYLRFSKDEYLRRQAQLFQTRKDIFVGYSTFEISRKNKEPGIYGISMRQDYQSNNYSDEGYLFLLVDFLGAQPQIYVRSWQPREWNDSSLIKLSNFNVNR